MNIKTEVQTLVRARKELENKLKELDAKIDHVLFRMNEERRCFARKCPLDDPEDADRLK